MQGETEIMQYDPDMTMAHSYKAYTTNSYDIYAARLKKKTKLTRHKPANNSGEQPVLLNKYLHM